MSVIRTYYTMMQKIQHIVPHRAPTVGEHTAQILTELGYSEDEIEQFSEKGIV